MDSSSPQWTRRDFVKGTGALLGGVAAGHVLAPAWTSAAPPAEMPQVILGRTGQKVSRLGIGCGHFWRAPNSPQSVAEILHRALDLGVNYFDTAPDYGDPKIGFSEEMMGPVVKQARDRFFLVTKTERPTYEETWKLIRQSMKRLQTDHLDLVHLHNFGGKDYFPDLRLTFSDKGALGALVEARQKGAIRFIGATGHVHPSRFHEVLDTGKIDVLMNAVNFICRHTYDFEHKVWSRARQANIGLVGMKILGGAAGGGRGFKIPEQHYRDAIRYAISIPGLHVAVIGVQSIAELEKAAHAVATAQPLDDAERHALAETGLKLAATDSWKAAYGTPIT